MDDLISRQAAIDAYGDWYVEEGTEDGFIGTVKQLLEGFPSALGTNLASLGTDLISRAQAIEIVQNRHMMLSKEKVLLINDLEKLPSAQPYTIHSDGRLWITVDDIDKVTAVVVDEHKSKFCKQFYEDYEDAQPEITYCKDCKHHWTHKCMDSMPIERCDLEQTFYDAEIDYCSLAERREDG